MHKIEVHAIRLRTFWRLFGVKNQILGVKGQNFRTLDIFLRWATLEIPADGVL